jgi:hypothetical protein
MLIGLLQRFQYVRDIMGELAERKHEAEIMRTALAERRRETDLFQKVIDTMASTRDVLVEYISDLRAEREQPRAEIVEFQTRLSEAGK